MQHHILTVFKHINGIRPRGLWSFVTFVNILAKATKLCDFT